MLTAKPSCPVRLLYLLAPRQVFALARMAYPKLSDRNVSARAIENIRPPHLGLRFCRIRVLPYGIESVAVRD